MRSPDWWPGTPARRGPECHCGRRAAIWRTAQFLALLLVLVLVVKASLPARASVAGTVFRAMAVGAK